MRVVKQAKYDMCVAILETSKLPNAHKYDICVAIDAAWKVLHATKFVAIDGALKLLNASDVCIAIDAAWKLLNASKIRHLFCNRCSLEVAKGNQNKTCVLKSMELGSC